MKKLLPLSVPIVLWIGNYFLWSFAGQFIKATPTAAGFWWLTTCALFLVATFISVGWAFIKMDN